MSQLKNIFNSVSLNSLLDFLIQEVGKQMLLSYFTKEDLERELVRRKELERSPEAVALKSELNLESTLNTDTCIGKDAM